MADKHSDDHDWVTNDDGLMECSRCGLLLHDFGSQPCDQHSGEDRSEESLARYGIHMRQCGWHDEARGRYAYEAVLDTCEGAKEDVVSDAWEFVDRIRAEARAEWETERKELLKLAAHPSAQMIAGTAGGYPTDDRATRILANAFTYEYSEKGEPPLCNYCDSSWPKDGMATGAEAIHEQGCPVPLAREVESLRRKLVKHEAGAQPPAPEVPAQSWGLLREASDCIPTQTEYGEDLKERIEAALDADPPPALEVLTPDECERAVDYLAEIRDHTDGDERSQLDTMLAKLSHEAGRVRARNLLGVAATKGSEEVGDVE